MSSFVDRFRASGVKPVRLLVYGFDPDLDTTGWACLEGTCTKPATGPALVQVAHLGLIRISSRGLNELGQAEAMAQAVATGHPLPSSGVTAVFVEAQQVYPNPDEEPRKRTAKANDLIRLAQVTGAVQAAAYAAQVPLVRAVLPATWKGQKEKHVTATQAIDRLSASKASVAMHLPGGVVQTGVSELKNFASAFGHAMDALGLAYYGLDLMAREGGC